MAGIKALFSRIGRSRTPPLLPSWDIQDVFPLRVRHSARARRLTLRIDAKERCAVLVVPPGISETRARDFVVQNRGWMETRLARLPQATPFCDGGALPLLGQEHVIRHVPAARRGVWCEEGIAFVSGSIEHLPRRLTDWLKLTARRTISEHAYPLAQQVGKPIRRITIRDTVSRWGSCSARGDLSFSWRLILAPETVLRYVVAHEVAHLREGNHGPAFWTLTSTLHPAVDEARLWLKRNGNRLMVYGRD